MAIEERDAHSGYLTTGHEWNGIKELNTPVPRAVYFFLITTAIFSFVYWILMPSWPTGVSFTRGLLGNEGHATVVRHLRAQGRVRVRPGQPPLSALRVVRRSVLALGRGGAGRGARGVRFARIRRRRTG